MPWKETCSMDERVRLIALWNEGQMTVSELGRVFGISRKTAYKWLERYEQVGAAGLPVSGVPWATLTRPWRASRESETTNTRAL